MDLEPITSTQASDASSDAPPRRRRRTRTLAIAVAGVAIVVLGVGASGAFASTPTPSPTAGATQSTTDGPVFVTAVDPASEGVFKDFAACMRDHGVDMPDPVRLDASSATRPTIEGAGVPETGTTTSGSIIVSGTGTAVAGSPASLTPDPTFQAASTACQSILDKAGIGTTSTSSIGVVGGSGTLSLNTAGGPANLTASSGAIAVVGVAGGDVTKATDGMKAYAACMRDRGVDVPDPVVDPTSGAVQLSVATDPGSAAFRAADSACATDGFGFPAPPTP